MARQGNYVSAPGGSVNWTSGLSKSLSNLSKSLLDQGAEEERLAREEEATALANKRYEEELAYRKEKDAVARGRADRAEARQTREYELADAKRTATQELNRIALDYDPSKAKYTEDDYGDARRGALKRREELINTDRDRATAYLTGGDDKSLDAAVDAFAAQLNTSGLTKDHVKTLKDKRRLNLQALRNELDALPAEERGLRLADELQRVYSRQYERYQEGVESGRALTKGEKVDALIRTLPENVRNNVDIGTIRNAFESRINGLSRADILAAEQARVDDINEAKKFNISNQVALVNKIAGKTRKSGNTESRITNALESLGSEMGIGNIDDKRMKEGFYYLVEEEGIDPEVAAAVIGSEKIDYGLATAFPSVDANSSDFVRIVERANALQSSVSRSPSGGYTAKTDLPTYTPAQARGIDELLVNRLDFGKVGNLGFTPSEGYTQELLDRQKAAAQKVLEDNSVEANRLPPPGSLATPNPRSLEEQFTANVQNVANLPSVDNRDGDIAMLRRYIAANEDNPERKGRVDNVKRQLNAMLGREEYLIPDGKK